MQTTRLGYLFVFAAALLWAMSGTASKFLFQGGVTPFQLVQLRTTISAAVLFLWLFFYRRNLLKLEQKHLRYFLVLGMVLSVTQFTYLYAISRIAVSAAILLQYQAPVLIALYAVIINRKRLSFPTFLAIAGAVLGCYLMVGAYNLNILSMNRAGILSGLASAVAFAWYAVKSEDGMRTHAPWTILSYALIVAAVVWNVLQPPLGAFMGGYSLSLWGLILFVGLFGTVLPFGLYNEGIKRINATHASITATLEPVMAGVISYVYLGEVMEVWQIIGAALVLATILLLQLQKKGRT